MSTKLKVAIEKSTYIITVSFFDEAEAAEDVKTMKWTLTDKVGTVINDREDVVVSDPGSVETIVLSGDDLAILEDEPEATKGKRLFTVEATYDSTLGSDLPLNGEATFTVVDLTAIEDGITP